MPRQVHELRVRGPIPPNVLREIGLELLEVRTTAPVTFEERSL